MIPYKDDNPTRRIPYVTITLIVINSIVLIMQALNTSDPGRTAYAYGAIPHSLLSLQSIQPIHPVLTVFTSMFMHGGLLHFGSNMLYLWIFGDNIEDRLGYGKFILFYIISGTVAAYSHALAYPGSYVPMIGASGAVSGVLGAYLILFPQARVHTLIILGFFYQVVRLPAVLVIGFWIVLQFINGLLSKGAAGQAGVAWFAHIGGFIAGIVLIKFFFRERA